MSTLQLQLSHFGFHVRDLEAMARFYRGALLFTETDRGNLGTVQLVFLSRDPAEHHQLVLANGRPEGAFALINQISFRVPDLPTLRAFHQRVLAHGAADVQPVTHGNAISVYCRDPEGNRIEIFMDTPWYCEQPLREPVDLAQDDAAVLARAHEMARGRPRFMPRAQWQQELALRMQADQAG
ncbi:MAG: glyoxalase/bleomycin resistance/dioxygenase protein [Ramlibacter sp.]|nr:glyoxalase/bleomycin resistance/dioxygenase protein [Ramlibacter sp.]MDB5915612.1 glyoxalase/bleomycin resistance/dioxygenase protein [Ramlibacter sp.]